MPRKSKSDPALSDAEWKVMRALWRRSPATAREILDVLAEDTGWAYTTLRTLLARLVEKGAVLERKDQGTSVYQAILREERARSSAVKALLSRAFDGGFGSLVHFMMENEELSTRDRARLQELLNESKRKGERS